MDVQLLPSCATLPPSGTFVTELLRREFPDAIMMNGVVCPYAAGEVCVQHYNSVLTLSKLVVVRSPCVCQRYRNAL